MFESLPLSSKFVVLVVLLVLVSSIQFSQATFGASLHDAEATDASGEELQEQRRVDNFEKLRHFLLTSNAEQRAARRDKQTFFKRKLIREYLQSANEPDSSHHEEVRKRICASLEEFQANYAVCKG